MPPFAPYRRQHVNPSLISRGQERYRANAARLAAIERRFGVEASVLMAIYGQETSYGTVTGNFDLLDALATLAYEGRRRTLFEGEFVAALKLLDRGTPRYRLKGSWAGATGYPQFMPSAVLRLAADGDGDGVADIWRSEIGRVRLDRQLSARRRVEAQHPLGRPGARAARLQSRARSPRRWSRRAARGSMPATASGETMREWRALGVSRSGRPRHRENEQLRLIEPDGPTPRPIC